MNNKLRHQYLKCKLRTELLLIDDLRDSKMFHILLTVLLHILQHQELRLIVQVNANDHGQQHHRVVTGCDPEESVANCLQYCDDPFAPWPLFLLLKVEIGQQEPTARKIPD